MTSHDSWHNISLRSTMFQDCGNVIFKFNFNFKFCFMNFIYLLVCRMWFSESAYIFHNPLNRAIWGNLKSNCRIRVESLWKSYIYTLYRYFLRYFNSMYRMRSKNKTEENNKFSIQNCRIGIDKLFFLLCSNRNRSNEIFKIFSFLLYIQWYICNWLLIKFSQVQERWISQKFSSAISQSLD